eukprot:13528443-Alexandrium_andersonii.AAC.1
MGVFNARLIERLALVRQAPGDVGSGRCVKTSRARGCTTVRPSTLARPTPLHHAPTCPPERP